MNNGIALSTESLVKSYELDGQKFNAVNSISLAVATGEFVGLVGPSGSGKTTLLAMLSALLTPTTGQVIIDGSNLAEMTDKQRVEFRRKRVGFTFQANNLIPYLTALENVELMLRLNGELNAAGRARSRDLLGRLGLSDRLHNLPSQMSGGQQQRVAIARALIHNPAVVLADEPTASLDTERAHQVVETFAQLIHEHNRAGVIVTHDLRMITYTDRVIQMRDGDVARIYTTRAEIKELAASGPG
ncbi:MAG: ABC transporter ATP-binding protein [Chloroflexi bacterium]|jgi:putative ABC transport system ATP-binding protein|nr:MAG: ABC transporter ATP-binding protein [Chloroflexota bacterium]RLT48264.1 MAG: ABC transporter ATP-binding protein [Chloroflexota bacterium]RLT52455.1 MAG: ABC transporter ATP-binding protein [Chloroflexota bacterium]